MSLPPDLRLALDRALSVSRGSDGGGASSSVDSGASWDVYTHGYSHLKELAPTTELRALQYAEDAKLGEGKRSRTALAPEYVERYTEEILDRIDFEPILRWVGASRAALLCVERDPEACHRSLVAARLASAQGFAVEDLRPPE
ncbi:MAG: DUF488 domain-containing protein [Solirubrobacterales bacterium]|nr:DUF488 domain-containing protein [Solirubrobacterales bacterium]